MPNASLLSYSGAANRAGDVMNASTPNAIKTPFANSIVDVNKSTVDAAKSKKKSESR